MELKWCGFADFLSKRVYCYSSEKRAFQVFASLTNSEILLFVDRLKDISFDRLTCVSNHSSEAAMFYEMIRSTGDFESLQPGVYILNLELNEFELIPVGGLSQA